MSPMENHSYSSYPDSRDSSPRSREIDSENPAWDEPQPNSTAMATGNNIRVNISDKVKFMCSYGGKIQPRAHDNQLAYIGGETKILAVDRGINFSAISSKLSSLSDSSVCFKYQLPGEDLDALISVTNDEDLEHMMSEYDRLYRASVKPARLRLFLFPLNSSAPTSFGSNDSKSERQWFVDALNSVQIQPAGGSSLPAVPANPEANPDFLFGLDKGYPPLPASNLAESSPAHAVPDSTTKDVTAGSDCGSEDRHVTGNPVMSPSEIQLQIQELQRLQIASQEQASIQRKSDEVSSWTYPSDYYGQKIQEKVIASPISAQTPVPMPIPTPYFQERHLPTGMYPMAAAPTPTGTEQSIYLIPTAAGLYQAQTIRPMQGPVGQTYYGMQRVIPEVYNAVPQHASYQQPKVGGYATERIQMVQPKVAMADTGYPQVGYDAAGRQVFYTAASTGVVPSYGAVAPVAPTVDGRPGVGNLTQEAKVVPKVQQTSGI